MFWKRKPSSKRREYQPLKRCSFCNKSQRDVEKLIAGPKVYICCQCVDICRDILNENRIIDAGKTPEELERDRRLVESGVAMLCALCSQLKELAELVQVPERGWVCKKCIEAVRSVGPPSLP